MDAQALAVLFASAAITFGCSSVFVARTGRQHFMLLPSAALGLSAALVALRVGDLRTSDHRELLQTLAGVNLTVSVFSIVYYFWKRRRAP